MLETLLLEKYLIKLCSILMVNVVGVIGIVVFSILAEQGSYIKAAIAALITIGLIILIVIWMINQI